MVPFVRALLSSEPLWSMVEMILLGICQCVCMCVEIHMFLEDTFLKNAVQHPLCILLERWNETEQRYRSKQMDQHTTQLPNGQFQLENNVNKSKTIEMRLFRWKKIDRKTHNHKTQRKRRKKMMLKIGDFFAFLLFIACLTIVRSIGEDEIEKKRGRGRKTMKREMNSLCRDDLRLGDLFYSVHTMHLSFL